MEKTIEIQKKSKPVVFLAILVLAIGASGLWVLLRFIFPMLQGFFDLKISAILAISVLTIWAIYLIIRQSSKTKPGLIIDEQGITDHSNMASIGLIPWSDITSVKEEADVFKRKLIVIIVKTPDVYINKTSMMRESRRSQYKQFGSPIVIAAGNLEYDSHELVSILKNRAG